MNRRWILLGLASITMLATVAPVEARRFRLPRGIGRTGGGSKSYTGNTLTQKQLERCLVDGEALDDAEAFIAQEEIAISAANTDLEALSTMLQREGLTLDRYSQIAVDRYNENVALYETKRLQFNEQVDAFNAGINQFNGSVAGYNTSCNGKTYYEDDMDAARLAVGISD